MSIARSQVARQGQWGLRGVRGVGGPLGLLAAAVLAGLGARAEPARADAAKDRPNILFILADDYGITGTGCYGGKGSMKEGGSRVPLICNWKGTTPAGRVLNDLVDFSDFFTTFAELSGAKPPAGVTLDGHGFAPQIRGLPGKPRDWVYVQLGNARYVRDARWKLTGEGQLSDLQDAPFREIPVSAEASPEAQSAHKKLQAVLDDFRAQDQWAGKAIAKKEKKAKKAGQAEKVQKKDRAKGAKRKAKPQP